MKCPKCNAKILKNVDSCPHCSHLLTDEEKKTAKKKSRVLWYVLGPILLLALGCACFLFWNAYVVSNYELVEINVLTDDIEFGAPIPVQISIVASGMLSETFEIPVDIDGETVHSFFITYDGGKAGNTSRIDKQEDIACDASTTAGNHEISAKALTDKFDVLTAPSFDVKYSADAAYYITGYPLNIDYTITNVGETDGEYVYSVALDGQTLEENTLELASGETESLSIEVSAKSSGVQVLQIGDESFDLLFYDSRRNSTELIMESTIRGYSEVRITNNTDKDLVCFLVTRENEDLAVAACYVQGGDKFTIPYIGHGNYILVCQYGTKYIPELYQFYNHDGTMMYGVDLEANVVGGAGFATTSLVKLSQERIDSNDFLLELTPTIPEISVASE